MFRDLVKRLPISQATLLRVAILGATVLGLPALGWLMIRFPRPELIPLAIVALGAGLLILHKLELGVLAIIFAAATVRFGIPTGTQSELVASLVLTGVCVVIWIIKMLVEEKRIRFRPASINWPLLGFVATCVVSLVWSDAFRDLLVVTWDSWPFVQLGSLAVMVLLPGALILTANCISDSKWLMWLTGMFIVIGAVGNFGYVLGLGEALGFLQVRPLFPTWVMSLSYAQALFNRRLSWPVRIFLLLVAAGWFYEQFVHQIRWLSGWVPAVASLGVISVLRSKYLPILMVIVLLFYGVVNTSDLTERFQEEQTASGDTRIAAWLNNWRVTGQHWLFGTGPAGYAAYYMSYFPLEAMATHSTYIDVLSQTGVVGLAFFLWLFAALAISGWKLVRFLKDAANFEEGFSVATLGGCVAAIISMALGDWLVPFAYTQTIAGFDYAVYTWILLGGMMSLHYIVHAREAGLMAEEKTHGIVP